LDLWPHFPDQLFLDFTKWFLSLFRAVKKEGQMESVEFDQECPFSDDQRHLRFIVPFHLRTHRLRHRHRHTGQRATGERRLHGGDAHPGFGIHTQGGAIDVGGFYRQVTDQLVHRRAMLVPCFSWVSETGLRAMKNIWITPGPKKFSKNFVHQNYLQDRGNARDAFLRSKP